jgi:hypothetical protein
MRIYQTVQWCTDNESYAGQGACGQLCTGYVPRNKRSGVCRFYRKLQVTKDELNTLVISGYKALKKAQKCLTLSHNYDMVSTNGG